MDKSETVETMRPLVVRVTDECQQSLAELARVKGTNLASQIREAISLYVFSRLFNPELGGEIDAAEKRLRDRLNASLRTPTVSPPLQLQRSPSAPANATSQLSVRLDVSQFIRLESLALVDDGSVAEQARRAFQEYIDQMERDELVQAALTVLRDQEKSLTVTPSRRSLPLGPFNSAVNALDDLDPAN